MCRTHHAGPPLRHQPRRPLLLIPPIRAVRRGPDWHCAVMLTASPDIAARRYSAERASHSIAERLAKLPHDELWAMYESAAEATSCLAAYAEAGINPVTAAIASAATVIEWAHYPAGDAVGPNCQFYYHTHAADERATGEHGHFHVFLRTKQPPCEPRLAVPSDETASLSHLVGISMDASGNIIRLFTTNHWVTGEIWYGANAMIRMFDDLVTQPALCASDLGRWVTAMLGMFRLEIEDLIRARDSRLREFEIAHPSCNALEDRALYVTSERPVNFLSQIRAIEAALCKVSG